MTGVEWSTALRNAANTNIITLPSATRHAADAFLLGFDLKTAPHCQF
jgi:hypothetical protein